MGAAIVFATVIGSLAVAGGTTASGPPGSLAAVLGSRVVATSQPSTPPPLATIAAQSVFASVTAGNPPSLVTINGNHVVRGWGLSLLAANGSRAVRGGSLSLLADIGNRSLKGGATVNVPTTPAARLGNLTTDETAFDLYFWTPFEPVPFQHSRALLLALSSAITHTRTILESSPPLPVFTHTRTLRRPLLPFTHTRTIIPELVLLQSGLASSGLAQGGSSTAITLASSASAVNGAYVGMWVSQGGESRQITAYNGTTKVATVAAWTTPPTGGTPYTITINKPETTKILHPTATVVET